MKRIGDVKMKYSIDSAAQKPAYLQLYTQIRDDITGDIYKYGDKLPSKRIIAAESGVSVITAEHAYGILCDEGYIEPRQRSGYFVIYKNKDFFPVSHIKKHETVKLKNDISDGLFSYTAFAKTARYVLTEYGERIFEKSPTFGCSELKTALSDYLARSRGINVYPEQIVIGAGAEYLYALIIQMFGKKRYALENPSYKIIEKVYNANGAECELLQMGKDGILTEELEKTTADVLHVTPFNSFPSGITASASKRNEYVHWARHNNSIIIEDDFCSEFSVSTKTEDTLFSIEPLRSVIYMNTFSKTIAPAIRVGYMVLPKELYKDLLKKINFYSCTVSVFEQYIIAELINSGVFERHINKVRRNLRKNKSQDTSLR